MPITHQQDIQHEVAEEHLRTVYILEREPSNAPGYHLKNEAARPKDARG
jgi:hypothetical protein